MDKEVPITLYRRCNRNALLEYEYEFTYLVCEFNVIKPKISIDKASKKKNINFQGRLTNASPKIIAIYLEIRSIVQTNNIDLLAAVLT